jgi:hypothetical protein
MRYIPRSSFALMLPLLSLATGVDIAIAQNAGMPVAASLTTSQLGNVDYNFVAQANWVRP